MASPVSVTRQITKRLKLTKTVREIYRHTGLSFFPPNVDTSKPVLILSGPIQADFASVLLSKDFHFAICSCETLESEKLRMKKLNKNIVWVEDQFIAEIADVEGPDRLGALVQYFSKRHPEYTFDVLTEDNLVTYLGDQPLYDVTLNKMKLDSTGKELFEPYSDEPEASHRSGKLTRGTLMMSPFGGGEVVEKEGRVKVFGRQINRALHGDEVYVDGDRVVGIYKSKTRLAVGTIFSMSELEEGVRLAYLRPIDRKLPDIHVLTRLGEEYLNRKVFVHILDWSCSDETPRGVVFRVLGAGCDLESEVEAIFEHYQIDYFDESWFETCNRRRAELGMKPAGTPPDGKSKKPAGKASDGQKPEQLGFDREHFSVERAADDIPDGRRVDLRHLDVCSIDPPGCEDIDDALHCIQRDDHIEVGVHIADVSYYVLPGSILDLEAKNRSTTVYFPGRRINMLPPFLSSDLCSLHENQDRAVFSCVWKLDKDFNIVDTQIFRSLIRSRASLSYDRADEIIRGEECLPKEAALKEPLKLLLRIATRLREHRMDKGALQLSRDELRITPNGVEVETDVPTHYLVEEFMLLANITVAKFIYSANPDYSLLRKHGIPSAIELNMIDATSSKTLNDSVQRLDPKQATIVKRIITRSMQQALYFSSGDAADFSHYGLATEMYTHFTSPIRRYPDVLVHRTLSYILSGDQEMIDGLKAVVSQQACSLMNFRHRNAQNASRMADELMIAHVLSGLPEDKRRERGQVVSVSDHGVILFLPSYGLETFVKTPTRYNVFDEFEVQVGGDFGAYCLNRFLDVSIVGE